MIGASEAKNHILTSLHSSLKSKLEHDLHIVRDEPYNDDNSVVILWEKSI